MPRYRVTLEYDDRAPDSFDHVLLATGYRIDLRRLKFLSSRLRQSISCQRNAPRLSRSFESTVPKLHFVGCYAVDSFGPLLRFIAGTRFAAETMTSAVKGGAGTRYRTALSREANADAAVAGASVR